MPVGRLRPIEVVNYDPQWPLTFASLRRVIRTALCDLVMSIEHVGSTAVPGLAAKPIIDLVVVIKSASLLSGVIQSLANLGYFHEGVLGVPGREAFGREDHDVPRDGTCRHWTHHHLYVCVQASDPLERNLAFRNYLRENPGEASTYATLKRQLAQQYPHNMDSYVHGKTAFVEEILQRAMA